MLQPLPRARLQVWFVRVCSCVLVWTCLAQLVAVGDLWHGHSRLPVAVRFFLSLGNDPAVSSLSLRHQFQDLVPASPPYVPLRVYKSNGYLKVSCNGGLNQMRSEICDMVTVARFLNLTLVVPELDKRSFWADTSNFGDIFDVNHFINILRDEVHIVKRIPKRFKGPKNILEMPPVSWSNDIYYLRQILPLFDKYNVIHFNKTDARLANNGLPLEFQKLRCHVNYQALKFTPQIEALGNKLIKILQERGSYVALHLRYEMDMLAFSGCTRGCSVEEADELKRLRGGREIMWCTHCVEDQLVVWGPDQDYIACSGCGKLFEFPVSKSHRMIRKPKKIQERKHKHPIDIMSSTSTKSHGHELKRKLLQARKQKKSSLHMCSL